MNTACKHGFDPRVGPGLWCPACEAEERGRRRPRVYRDNRDWWIGYYRGEDYHYVCLLPTLVISWRRRRRRAS